MSSSVFYESPSDSDCDGNDTFKKTTDLVVVYKNNTLNVNKQDLQDLLLGDENSKATISVIRLSSPTPSMNEEEARLNDENENISLDTTENEELLATLEGRDSKKSVVGLHIEGFYPPEEAKILAKQILETAGVGKKAAEDLEIRRFACRFDHCYSKSSSDDETDKEKQSKEKPKSPAKQRKTFLDSLQEKRKREIKPKVVEDFSYEIEDADEDEEVADDEESYYSGSEESASTDNDRDSDLDFDVNDRNGKKKRKKSKKSPKKSLKVKRKLDVEMVEEPGSKKSVVTPKPSKQFGSFTDINNLANKKTTNIRVTQIPNKGFVSLGPETKKLPAQISVKEIPSTPTKDKEAKKEKEAEKLPELPQVEEIVKMLEKTETEIPSTPSTSFRSTVENIDISSAPLLDDGAESIPDDILEKVVELMDDSSNSNHKSFEGFVSPSKPSNDFDSFTPSFSAIKNGPMDTSTAQNPSGKKEGVVIVRGNRVITLPPIEAPTTRAKRRAQTHHSDTPEIGQIVSMSDVKVDEQATANIVSTAPSVVVNKQIIVDKKKTAVVSKVETNYLTKSGRRLSKKIEEPVEEDEEEEEEEGDFGDEDDPTKLWCICRQPHNNRFMICCDTCEEWFHGSCVHITKAMNLEMEAKKQEWICPPCKEKSQPKITQMFVKLPPKTDQIKIAPKLTTPEVKQAAPKQLITKIPPLIPKSQTIVAKPPPAKKQLVEIQEVQIIRPPSISTQQLKILPANAQKVLIPVTAKISQQPIKITNISTIPTATTNIITNIRQVRPQVTVVKLPSAKPAEVKKRNSLGISLQAPKSESSFTPKETGCVVCKMQTKNKKNYCSEECLRKYVINALPKAVHSDDEVACKKAKKNLFEDLLLSADSKPKLDRVCVYEKSSGHILTGANAPTSANIRKWLQEHPTFEIVQTGTQQALEVENMSKSKVHKEVLTPTVATPTTPTVSSPLTIQTPIAKFYSSSSSHEKDHSKKHSGASTSKSKDKDRDYVPKSDEKDKGRSKDKGRYSNEPIRDKVEKHLFESLFNRTNECTDTSFPKLNKEELQRFCRKTEEELYRLFNKDTGQKYKAKYRSLIFNIKDHKNEQLFRKISSKEVDPYRLVRMTAEELASQELSEWRQNENKHQLDMIKKNELDLLTQPKNYVLKSHKGEEVMEDKEIDNAGLPSSVEDVVAVLNNSLESEEDYSFQHAHNEHTHQHHSSASTSHDRHDKKSKEKERDKDKDRGRKSKDQKDKYKKRSQSHGRGDKEHEKHKRSKSPHKEKITPIKTLTEKSAEKKPSPKEDSKKVESAKPIQKKRETKPPETVDPTKEFNLIDKILESSKTIEEAANLVTKEKPVAIVPPSSFNKLDNKPELHALNPVDRRKLEKPYYKYYADETFNIWDGGINMNEVSSFQLYFQAISKCERLAETLTELELTVVGRINPKTVWDYLIKIKRSPNKVLDMIRLIPSSEGEVIGYVELFTYLKNLDRLGVIKPRSSIIKDFYVIPLGKNESLPPVLQNFNDLDLFKDPSRPDLLIGVVIRFGEGAKPLVKEPIHRSIRQNTDKELDKIIKEPFLNKPKSLFPTPPPPPPPIIDLTPTEDDGNEPYSPGRAFEDEVDTTVGKSVDDLTLDEVNRQIEERKKELQQIAEGALGKGISIPHNLSQILASIPKVPSSSSHTNFPRPDDDEYNPELVQPSSSFGMHEDPAFSDDDDGGPSTKKPRLN